MRSMTTGAAEHFNAITLERVVNLPERKMP